MPCEEERGPSVCDPGPQVPRPDGQSLIGCCQFEFEPCVRAPPPPPPFGCSAFKYKPARVSGSPKGPPCAVRAGCSSLLLCYCELRVVHLLKHSLLQLDVDPVANMFVHESLGDDALGAASTTDHTSRAWSVLTVNILFICLVAIVVSLRAFTKRLMTRKLYLEDCKLTWRQGLKVPWTNSSWCDRSHDSIWRMVLLLLRCESRRGACRLWETHLGPARRHQGRPVRSRHPGPKTELPRPHPTLTIHRARQGLGHSNPPPNLPPADEVPPPLSLRHGRPRRSLLHLPGIPGHLPVLAGAVQLGGRRDGARNVLWSPAGGSHFGNREHRHRFRHLPHSHSLLPEAQDAGSTEGMSVCIISEWIDVSLPHCRFPGSNTFLTFSIVPAPSVL